MWRAISSSLESQARVLWSDHQYAAAFSLLDRNLSDGALLDRARRLKDESERGIHDVSKFYLERVSPGDAAEYIGPLEIRKTDDGRGCGIFLTADARIGDLLFVNNAVAVLDPSELGLDLETRKRNLLSRVMDRCRSSNRVMAQVRSMYCGDYQEAQVPEMGIFLPNVNTRELDRFASGDGELEEMPAWDEGTDFWGTRYFGLWPFHSFVNHSCCEANISSCLIGNAYYGYASRDLAAGSEILREYWSKIALEPYGRRRSMLPFLCRCARCRFEERIASDRLAAGFVMSEREEAWLIASNFERCWNRDGFLESMREVSPGSFLVIQAALRCMGDPEKNPKILEFVRETVVEACGRQKEEVIQAIIDKFRCR